MQSQEKQILKDLKAGNQVTPMEALHKYGCFRLSARILDLKSAGYPIQTQIIKENGKRFARYYLAQ